MRLIPRTLKWRTFLLTLLGLVAVGVSVWWTFRAEISAFVKRQQTLGRLRASPHSLDRGVGDGELQVGILIEEWVAAHPPKSRTRHDEYDTVLYEGNVRRNTLWVIAVDGVIVYAGTGIDEDEALIGGLSPQDRARYFASIRRHERDLIAGLAAVGGVAGNPCRDRWKFPTPGTNDLTEQP